LKRGNFQAEMKKNISQKRKQTKLGVPEWVVLFAINDGYRSGEIMAQDKKNNQFKHKKTMPKTDVEFAATGLEKIALRAQKTQNK